MEVSQDAKDHVVSLEVPVDEIDLVYKALEDQLEKAAPGESLSFFVQQNPATKKMMDIVNESYVAMSEAMLSEIRDVLSGKATE